jgi:O-antigen ligase
LFFLSGAISYFYSNNHEEALRKIILKLPILLAPSILFSFKNASTKTIKTAIASLSYAAFLPSVVSAYNYFTNKALFDGLILESKPLPIEFGYGIYHIQFSIFLAIAILIGIFHCINLFQKKEINLHFYFVAFSTLVNLYLIHILSTRTGLVSLYLGLLLGFLFLLKNLNKKAILAFTLGAILLPIGMYFGSQSLQNRIQNSIKDVQVVWNNKNPNDYSFAMRVQAWQNALDVLSDNWILGVGIGDSEKILFENFKSFNPNIEEKNRKNPHFQLIESMVQSGFLSAVTYLGIFISLFVFYRKKSPMAVVISMMLLLASCFESILERQASVACFAVFIPFCMMAFSEKQSDKKASL